MQYQLVIQFLENSDNGLNKLFEIEEYLNEELTCAEVDGHDIGSGQMNIFILTDSPIETFKQAKNILKKRNSFLSGIKIAYRDIGRNKFILLWPKGLENFDVI